MRSNLRVLFEDNHCLAVFKPPGLLTVGDRTGHLALIDLAREYLKEKYDKPGNVFVGVVHRLDRPVGGVVLFARTGKAAGRLAEQFRSGRVEKIYEALVEGRVVKPEETLVDHLVKDRTQNTVRRTDKETRDARESMLAYRRVQSWGDTTLLEVRPRTGRSHQIRVQLAGAGHPIIGDRKYGSSRPFREGIALRAVSLTFEHPTHRTPVTVSANRTLAWDNTLEGPYNRD